MVGTSLLTAGFFSGKFVGRWVPFHSYLQIKFPPGLATKAATKRVAWQIFSSWWFQSIWKICSSNWGSFPQVGMKIKDMWNHHPVLHQHLMTSLNVLKIGRSHKKPSWQLTYLRNLRRKIIQKTLLATNISPYQKELLRMVLFFPKVGIMLVPCRATCWPRRLLEPPKIESARNR